MMLPTSFFTSSSSSLLLMIGSSRSKVEEEEEERSLLSLLIFFLREEEEFPCLFVRSNKVNDDDDDELILGILVVANVLSGEEKNGEKRKRNRNFWILYLTIEIYADDQNNLTISTRNHTTYTCEEKPFVFTTHTKENKKQEN